MNDCCKSFNIKPTGNIWSRKKTCKECGASLVESDELWQMALDYKTTFHRIDIAEARRILNL